MRAYNNNVGQPNWPATAADGLQFVLGWTETHDPSNCFVPSTGTWTCPSRGLYRVRFVTKVITNAVSASDFGVFLSCSNGVVVSTSTRIGGGGISGNPTTEAVFDCNVGDTIRPMMQVTDSPQAVGYNQITNPQNAPLCNFSINCIYLY